MVNVYAFPGYQIVNGNNSIILNRMKFQLLQSILDTGSLTAVAKELNVSYGTVLNYIDQIESGLNIKIISTKKGGKGGGGGTTLTDEGLSILMKCKKINANAELHNEINELHAEVINIDEEKGMMTLKTNQLKIDVPLQTNYSTGDKTVALINCGNIVLMLEPQISSICNIFKGKVVEMKLKNEIIKVTVDVEGVILRCDITISSGRKLNLHIGSDVYVGVKATSIGLLKV